MIRIIVFTILFTVALYFTSFFPEWGGPTILSLFVICAFIGYSDEELGVFQKNARESDDGKMRFESGYDELDDKSVSKSSHYPWTGPILSVVLSIAVVIGYSLTIDPSTWWGIEVMAAIFAIAAGGIGYISGYKLSKTHADLDSDYFVLHKKS